MIWPPLLLTPQPPAIARLLPLLALQDGPTLSEFERELVAFCDRASLPRPQVNRRVAGREVDNRWTDQRLIVQLDGRAHHESWTAAENDRAKDTASPSPAIKSCG